MAKRIGAVIVSPWQSALFSLLLPGSGQFLTGEKKRGGGLLISIVILVGLILWRGVATLFAPLAAIWLWNVWDAYRLAGGRKSAITLPALLGIFVVYALGSSATEIRPARLLSGWPSMLPYLRALTQPEFLEYPTEDIRGYVPIQVPCIDPLPEPERSASEDPRVMASVACADIDEVIEITGEGFFPTFEGEIWWVSPIGDIQRAFLGDQPVSFVADAEGKFTTQLKVPLAVPKTSLPVPGETQTHVIRAEQHRPYGSLQPTETLSLVLDKIGETVALAFMATILGLIFAMPVSFLAARNLMGGNPFTLAIYHVVRTTLNVVRSIETLMWAIVFAVWVGLGPFNGMLALMLHTIAALGKLYSEAIESIDPGPIEALRATGATGFQIVVYAVLPQILPTFLSFTLFRWDINVRMSTVIGLVSDAGLGFLVIQWIRLNRFSAMATAIIAIVLVVAVLDYVSAWLRKRVIEGIPIGKRVNPTFRMLGRSLVILGLFVIFIWSWRVSEINFVTFFEGIPDGLRLAKSFLVPEMFTMPTEERAVGAVLPVPCNSGDAEQSAVSGPRVNLSVPCGDVGDPLVIRAYELPPDTKVSVRWSLSDGAFLRVHKDCCTTDSSGQLQWDTKIHPLMQVDPDQGYPEPGQVVVTWKRVIGGPQISEAFKTVLNLSVVTLLMALMATSLGSVFAIPLSFLAARNIVGKNVIGRTVYYVFRTTFNLWRSIEPMILALICSAWVGIGPFAGVLALAINNIPNLAKLFSDTIEEIDTGPVEAIRATGATGIQTLVYGIVPQLVPKFLAFILYQWDINIRMSTVIGFVGGGGIGQQFRLWVGLNQYSAAGMATWAIVAMVWGMDYASAKAREKLV
ncbi:MAG: phosphonate ABC transporter, permease protein PhnE [Anaerolineae bacterium]|nr:phosphonate ABC transporter, permease protein PhnE [Anaerolineae bacterium]